MKIKGYEIETERATMMEECGTGYGLLPSNGDGTGHIMQSSSPVEFEVPDGTLTGDPETERADCVRINGVWMPIWEAVAFGHAKVVYPG